VSPALARPAAAIDLDKLDPRVLVRDQLFEDPTPSKLVGQWHDAATKLDLAKAYQEMGDRRSAQQILQEVRTRRRHAESRSAGAASQARLTRPTINERGDGSDIRRPFHFGCERGAVGGALRAPES
jgi:hypothetical protein